MHTLVALAGAMLICSSGLAKEPHCSLWVGAALRDGRPVYANARVVDGTGRVIEKAVGLKGVEFCDLGIKEVQVTILPVSASCSWSVTVGTRLEWGTTKRATVVVPDQQCELFPHLAEKSTLLIRAVDEDGKNLSHAELAIQQPSSLRKVYVADSYGRVLVTGIPFGTELTMALSANDHKPETLRILCDEEEIEKNIELVWAGRESPRVQGGAPKKK